jgi:hypothetical protein
MITNAAMNPEVSFNGSVNYNIRYKDKTQIVKNYKEDLEALKPYFKMFENQMSDNDTITIASQRESEDSEPFLKFTYNGEKSCYVNYYFQKGNSVFTVEKTITWIKEILKAKIKNSVLSESQKKLMEDITSLYQDGCKA